MPQSQTTANPQLQEEEKNDKYIHAQKKQTNVREARRPAPSSPREVIRMLKQMEKRGQRAREDFKTPSASRYKPQSYTEFRNKNKKKKTGTTALKLKFLHSEVHIALAMRSHRCCSKLYY